MISYERLRPQTVVPSLPPAALALPDVTDVTDVTDDAEGRPRRRTARDWTVDVASFVVALGPGLYLETTERSSHEPSTRLMLLNVSVALVLCSLLWWRRRWPVAIALLFATVGRLSTMTNPASVLMVFTVAVHRRAPLALLVTAVYVVPLPVSAHLYGSHDGSWWHDSLVNFVVAVIMLGWGMFVRARRQLVVSLRDRALHAEQEQRQRVRQARHLERTRIAREMHDVLAHRLSLLSMHAGALAFRPDAAPEQVTATADVIRTSAHQALEELREVIGVLRRDDPDETLATAISTAPGTTPGKEPATPATGPDVPHPSQPGLDAIPTLITESTHAGQQVRYRCDPDPPQKTDPDDVSRSVSRTAYRVVQEGLTNARKHAPGTIVDVTTTKNPDHTLTVEVTNPLPPHPPQHPIPGSGLGLIGLGERVELAGGRLTHERTPDGRFVLRAVLPCRR